MAIKACKKCKRLVRGDKCPVCKTGQLSESWKGKIIVIDSNKSEVAEKMKITEAGEYAIR